MKSVVRGEARARRQGLAAAHRRQAAERAAAHLARACRRWGARHVAVYLGTAEELDTAPLVRRLREWGCRLYAPKVAAVRGRMGLVVLHRTLRRNRYGIREPAATQRPWRIDVIVLPLVAFDAEGNRLGMGGGYYDRLLSRARPHRRPLRVGFAYKFQEVAGIPSETHDARLDAVVTERGVRLFR